MSAGSKCKSANPRPRLDAATKMLVHSSICSEQEDVTAEAMEKGASAQMGLSKGTAYEKAVTLIASVSALAAHSSCAVRALTPMSERTPPGMYVAIKSHNACRT